MAKFSMHRTRNPEVPSLPESHSDHWLDLFLGCPEFNSSIMLVNSQLVCLLSFGVLNHVVFDLDYLFVII